MKTFIRFMNENSLVKSLEYKVIKENQYGDEYIKHEIFEFDKLVAYSITFDVQDVYNDFSEYFDDDEIKDLFSEYSSIANLTKLISLNNQKGFGSLLMEYIIKDLRNKKYDCIFLYAYPFNTKNLNKISKNKLVEFYKKFGFKVIKKDDYSMILEL